jgi:hypothetical protein
MVDTPDESEWSASYLGNPFVGTVGSHVPPLFEGYVRLCHAPLTADGGRTDWSAVAVEMGRVAHPLMQWHAIVGSQDPMGIRGSQWSGQNPQRGELDSEARKLLCALLARHTTSPERCSLAWWDGWNDPDEAEPKPISARMETPGRNYLIGFAPVAQAANPKTRWPNLLWPPDRAWFVASEIDFDSTLIGGTTNLVEALLGSGLDSWPISPGDSLQYDADRVNVA